MALTDTSTVMPVAPSGFGNGFGNDMWIIILFILLAGGGWGNGFGYGGVIYSIIGVSSAFGTLLSLQALRNRASRLLLSNSD